MTAARLAELERNLAGVRKRIAAACRAAGRDPATVTLVAVSKTWPASDVLLLHRLGVTDFGENYDREAATKAGTLRATGAAPRWHFVGQVQRNKARSVAGYADVVHSVDRPELAGALGAAAVRAGRCLDALVQVSLDQAPDRGGCDPDDLARVAERVARTPGLRLAGVMAVAPLGEPPRPAFARLRALAEQLRETYPEATAISAGMSADLVDAIAEGATYVRVGTALFGERPAAVG